MHAPRSRSPALITRPWLRPLAWLLLQILLLGLGLMSLTWNAVAWLLLPLLSLDRARAATAAIHLYFTVFRAAIARGYRGFWHASRFSGLLQMDASAIAVLANEPGLIIVANHPSMLDAVMLVSELPRCACVMKASLARNPFLGAGASLARYIRNDSSLGLVRLAVDDLKAGGQQLSPRPPLPIVFSVRLGQRFSVGDDPRRFQAELEAYFAAGVTGPQQPMP